MGEHGPNIDRRWTNIAPRWANISPSRRHFRGGRGKVFLGVRPCWPLGRAFLESTLQHDLKMVQMGLVMRPTWAQNETVIALGQNTFWKKMIATWTLTWLQHGPSKAEVNLQRTCRPLVGAKMIETWNSQATGRGRRQTNLRQTIQTYNSQATGESFSISKI